MNFLEVFFNCKLFKMIIEKLSYENKKYINKKALEKRTKSHRERVSGSVGGLSSEQENKIYKFYEKYQTLFGFDINFHKFYYENNNIWSEKYIPDDWYYCYVDTYFNDWNLANTFDNKCFYPRMFPGVKQPEIVFSRLNGFWTDSNRQSIKWSDVKCEAKKYDELVIKQANGSSGGKDVFFVDLKNDPDGFEKICKEIKNDIVVQKVLKQHPVLSLINKSSVNTIRIISFLDRDGAVKIYSSVLRMGINGSRVDNASSGGMSCGINADGTLKEVAYSDEGKKYYLHPTSGQKFSGITIPSFEKACETIKKLHPGIPHFRLVSWDIAIDETAEPVLIEANFSYGELTFHQLNNGPIFGDDTERILDEVFNNTVF